MINQTQIKFSPILELPYNPNLKQRAKELRQARNLPEVLFWMQVTKGGFHKLDFDRQRVIGNYIVDFYIKKLGLVIEIDGSSHIGKEEYDAAREEYLISLGLKVYRIQVRDIMKRMNEVLLGLENYIIENYGVVESTLVPPRPVDTPPKEGNLGKVSRPKKSLQIQLLYFDSPATNLHFKFRPEIDLHLLLSAKAEISSAEEQLMRNTLIR